MNYLITNIPRTTCPRVQLLYCIIVLCVVMSLLVVSNVPIAFVRVPQIRSHEGQTIFLRVVRQGILSDAHVDQSPEERAVPVVPVSTTPGAGHADRLGGHRGRHGCPKR